MYIYILTHFLTSQPALIKLDNENIGGHLTPLQTTKWEAQAKVMGKSTEHLQGWFKSMQDNYMSLHKPPKSKSRPRDMTDREKWTLKKLTFLQQITVHKPQPVSSVSTATYC